MKKNDFALIILIVSISLVVSFFLAQAIIGSPDNDPVEVEVVTPIEGSFRAPDEKVFNEDAINPSENIQIGDSKTDQPFNGE